MNKYEQLMEYIISGEEAKAKGIFHEIVVARSREIYESIMDEHDPAVHGRNDVEGLVDEITADEVGMHEDDMDMDMGMGDEPGMDDGMGGDEPGMGDEHGMDGGMGDEAGEHEEIEDRVMDLEDAIDELKAEFEKLMGGESGEDHEGGDEDMGSDEGDDDSSNPFSDEPTTEAVAASAASGRSGSGSAASGKMEGKNPFAKSGSGSAASGKSSSGSAASGKSGSGSGKKLSEAERLREYVDKVSDGHGADKKGAAEGHEVGKGGSATVNKQGIVAGKNDMGGTAANIAKGGSEQAPDGTTPKGKAGGFVKSASEIDVAKRNVNKPGGNKGASDFYGTKAKAKTGEGSTTDGSYSVNKQSLEPGKK
jgi:hypothetical protein